MRTWLTRGVVAALLGLGVAATVASLRPAVAGDAARERAPTAARGEAESPPPCARGQLALAVEVLGGSATIVLRHVRGRACRLADVPVGLIVTDRTGKRVRLASQGVRRLGGDFAPRFERLVDITYLPECGRRGPYQAVATAGSYAARRALSAAEIGCFRGG